MAKSGKNQYFRCIIEYGDSPKVFSGNLCRQGLNDQ
jgi:hypothetical protein